MSSEKLPSAPSRPSTPARPRPVVVDVLRGVALCGILWMNLQPVTRLGSEASAFDADPLPGILDAAVHGRFIALFAFLFGLSASLFLASAAERTSHPRRVLLPGAGFRWRPGWAWW